MAVIADASILNADLCRLGEEIKRAEKAGCEYLHFDVMDGVFVDNISYGLPVLSSVSKVASSVLDVHLMITNPLKYTAAFAREGADIITFHYESDSGIDETIDEIHKFGIRAGLALKPATPTEVLEEFLDKIDLVLIMSVNPGYGGQDFMPGTVERIEQTAEMIRNRNLKIPIQVDGGINELTAEAVKKAGAEILVAGSYLFNSSDMERAVRRLIG